MSRPTGCVEGEAPPSQQHSVSTGGSKFKSDRVALLVVGSLLAAAVIVIVRLSFAHMDTKRCLQTLRDALLKNLTEKSYGSIWSNCLSKKSTAVQIASWSHRWEITAEGPLKCGEDWEQLGERCYYFSSDLSPWEEARAECRKERGDLAQIDSEEEQSFLELKVRENMKYHEDRFWIGLTDSKEEGTWVWVDGSPLNTSLAFWTGHEPDNWGGEDPDGEDCVRMGEKEGAPDLNCWFDKSCIVPHRRICEKSAESVCLM